MEMMKGSRGPTHTFRHERSTTQNARTAPIVLIAVAVCAPALGIAAGACDSSGTNTGAPESPRSSGASAAAPPGAPSADIAAQPTAPPAAAAAAPAALPRAEDVLPPAEVSAGALVVTNE